MSDVPQTQAGFRITGWHVLAIVTSFFVLVCGVDFYFATLAYKTFPGQVSVTPYEDGLAFNRDVARRQAQAALGWSATAAPVAGGVQVEIADREGAPVQGLTLVGLLRRPATEAGEIALKFSEASPGRYFAAARPGAGAWDIEASAKDHPFKAERRLTWP